VHMCGCRMRVKGGSGACVGACMGQASGQVCRLTCVNEGKVCKGVHACVWVGVWGMKVGWGV